MQGDGFGDPEWKMRRWVDTYSVWIVGGRERVDVECICVRKVRCNSAGICIYAYSVVEIESEKGAQVSQRKVEVCREQRLGEFVEN